MSETWQADRIASRRVSSAPSDRRARCGGLAVEVGHQPDRVRQRRRPRRRRRRPCSRRAGTSTGPAGGSAPARRSGSAAARTCPSRWSRRRGRADPAGTGRSRRGPSAVRPERGDEPVARRRDHARLRRRRRPSRRPGGGQVEEPDVAAAARSRRSTGTRPARSRANCAAAREREPVDQHGLPIGGGLPAEDAEVTGLPGEPQDGVDGHREVLDRVGRGQGQRPRRPGPPAEPRRAARPAVGPRPPPASRGARPVPARSPGGGPPPGGDAGQPGVQRLVVLLGRAAPVGMPDVHGSGVEVRQPPGPRPVARAGRRRAGGRGRPRPGRAGPSSWASDAVQDPDASARAARCTASPPPAAEVDDRRARAARVSGRRAPSGSIRVTPTVAGARPEPDGQRVGVAAAPAPQQLGAPSGGRRSASPGRDGPPRRRGRRRAPRRRAGPPRRAARGRGRPRPAGRCAGPTSGRTARCPGRRPGSAGRRTGRSGRRSSQAMSTPPTAGSATATQASRRRGGGCRGRGKDTSTSGRGVVSAPGPGAAAAGPPGAGSRAADGAAGPGDGHGARPEPQHRPGRPAHGSLVELAVVQPAAVGRRQVGDGDRPATDVHLHVPAGDVRVVEPDGGLAAPAEDVPALTEREGAAGVGSAHDVQLQGAGAGAAPARAEPAGRSPSTAPCASSASGERRVVGEPGRARPQAGDLDARVAGRARAARPPAVASSAAVTSTSTVPVGADERPAPAGAHGRRLGPSGRRSPRDLTGEPAPAGPVGSRPVDNGRPVDRAADGARGPP